MGSTTYRGFFVSAALIGLVLLSPAIEAGKKKDDDRMKRKELQEAVAKLPPQYRSWLDDVGVLITREEKEVFVGLEKDYQRDAFIEAFWRSRDQYRDTGFNEFRDRYERLLREVRLMFEFPDEERARILLLNGMPDVMVDPTTCRSVIWPSQVWFYAGTERVRGDFGLVFYKGHGTGRFRVWRPDDGVRALVQWAQHDASDVELMRKIANDCSGEEIDALLGALTMAIKAGSFEFENMLGKLLTRPDVMSAEWLPTFASYTTDLPDGAGQFEARLAFSFPGRRQNRTVVQGVVSVPTSEVARSELAESDGYNFQLTGEVLREKKLFDTFRYGFNIPLADVQGDELPLVFERYLRPGSYQIVLKVEDLNGDTFWGTLEDFEVPRVEGNTPVPLDEATARVLAEANAAINPGDDTIELIEPSGDYQSGFVRFNTLTSGTEIAEVVFALDDLQVLRKKRPPYSVDLDLGELPRMRTLTVTAFDAEGNELDRDQLQLNAGSHRFAVRLVEPRSGQHFTTSLRAEAQVDVPDGEVVEKVEFYLNETLLATLYQEPWIQPVVLSEVGEMAYVRATAYRGGGNSTEDVVFINAPDYMEELDIQFVELYISAVDKQQRPVLGLGEDDFAVFEDGIGQAPTRFETVGDLPIHAGIMIDVSASMEQDLEMAQQAAVAFLEQTITAKDRATLMTFNDRPHLAVKFTNDLKVLGGGLAGLKAERGTALYDSIVFSLYYFNGVKGQRALILLSDGKDESSRFSFDQALEYARRAGVALYAIGLNLPKKDGGAKGKLKKLAAETGGQSFFVKEAGELAAIYAQIQEELRSRYYIAYQSSNASESDDFRTIEVKVATDGVEAKTLRGYYP